MIVNRSLLSVVDRSGILKVRCFRVIGSSSGYTGSLGCIVAVSVHRKLKKKLLREKLYFGVIVGTSYNIKRFSGIYVKSSNNILLFQGRDFDTWLDDRLRGPIFSHFRKVRGLKSLFFNRYLL